MKKIMYLLATVLCALLLTYNSDLKAESATTEIKVENTDKAGGHVYCYGYKWIYRGDWKIRCTCNGGPICYAAWQDLLTADIRESSAN